MDQKHRIKIEIMYANIIKMSKRQVLEYAMIHNAKLYDEIPTDVVLCRCRFGHKFLISSLHEWCYKCQSAEFLNELIIETRNEVESSSHGLSLLDVDYYGNATFNCTRNHTLVYDIDDIPESCDICKELGFQECESDSCVSMSDNDFDFIQDFTETSDIEDYIENYVEDDLIEDTDRLTLMITRNSSLGTMMISDIMDEWDKISPKKKEPRKELTNVNRIYRKSNLSYVLDAPDFTNYVPEA